ncbi:MAG: phytoene desaturase [Microbacterium sp.]|uniref:phytoene desaturase family protein n=1 Tax=Microbacterium sp. TaxID=51671 RepID=UPI001AC5A72F|nr:phytoene desaturase family protein [Microbacterium sp.]MBN9152431.1 phytoene desaturase [Microbacterium sp.]
MSGPRTVVVIGGGVSGLATAALLAADGHRVTLLEARSELGGRAGSWESQGFRFDTGPSWYLMPEVFDHFYRMLGTSSDEQLHLRTLDPGYRAYFEGDPSAFDLPAGRSAARAAIESLDPASAAQLERYFDSAEDTYRIALQHFLYSSFESARPFFAREVVTGLPRLAPLMVRSLDARIRAASSDSRIRRLLGYPAVFLGGSPMRVPSMYHLMSHLDVNDGVLYPEGGFARVIETLVTLAADAGADLITDARVERIVVADGAARGVRYRTADGDEVSMDADLVVATADLRHVEQELLADGERDHTDAWWRKRDPGPGAVLAMLGVRGALPQLAHHTLLLADDWDGAFTAIGDRTRGRPPETPSLYIGKPSASDSAVAPAGHENLFVLIPVPADPSMGHGGVDGTGDPAIESLVDRVITQIAAWTDAPDLAERIVVRRTVGPGDFADDLNAWSGSALGPAHTLRQSAFLRAGNASRKVSGLLFAGSSTIPGIGVPMCLISAELVLKRVRGDRSAAPLAEPRRAGS